MVDLAAAVRRHVDGKVAAGIPEDRFDIRITEPLTQLWADPDKVDQVLGNLLENAVRHGEGTVTIEVAPAKEVVEAPVWERPGTPPRVLEGTAVTVSDEGGGIPEESMPRVFTRFWRGSKRGGTGLGLYIVKGIVEAHGGSIRVDRAPGGGARFRFILPAGCPRLHAVTSIGGQARRATAPSPRRPGPLRSGGRAPTPRRRAEPLTGPTTLDPWRRMGRPARPSRGHPPPPAGTGCPRPGHAGRTAEAGTAPLPEHGRAGAREDRDVGTQ